MITKSDDRASGFRFVYHEYYKQLLDEVFVISKIIKVEVRVISLTETLIGLDITKTESNNCFLYIEHGSHVFASSLPASNTKRVNLT